MLFLLISCCVNIFFTIPAVIENSKLKPALAIPTGTLITIANEAIEMVPLVTDKTIKYL